MAKITAGNYSKDALSATKKLLRAAYASLQVPTVSSKRRLTVKKQYAVRVGSKNLGSVG
jgi:hypothetical protein